MKRIVFFSISIMLSYIVYCQSPQSINYQAVVRDGAGVVIPNQLVSFRISIQQSTSFTDVYVETQQETTNDFGLVNLQIGTGTVVSGVFADIDWASDLTFIQIELDETGGTNYQMMGLSQMLTVPYAFFADKAGNVNNNDTSAINELQNLSMSNDTLYLSNSGSNIYFPYSIDTNYWEKSGNDLYYNIGNVRVGDGSVAPSGRLQVKSDSSANINDVIFSVQNSKGDTVFAVYQEGVRIWVADDTSSAKASGNRGGFAVGGFNPSKSFTNEYLRVTPDSVRVYIEESGGTKASGNRGGFAVGGYSPSKTLTDYYFNIEHISDAETIDPSQPRFLWYPEKEAVLAGRVLIMHPDSVGLNSVAIGFENQAKGAWSQALGFKTITKGEFSTSIGRKTYTYGYNSFALGDSTAALGDRSIAFGYGARSVGIGAIALGTVSVNISGVPTGNYTIANGNYSFAAGMGAVTTNNALGSIALGSLTTVNGIASSSIGCNNYANGLYSSAIGTNNLSDGMYTLTLGSNDTASADAAMAIGFSNKATGNLSLAVGANNEASGVSSSVIGFSSIASGHFSAAYGHFVSTDGKQGSIVFGDYSSGGTYMYANNPNQFKVRASGGYVFHCDPALNEINTVYINPMTGDLGLGIEYPARKLHIKDVMRLEPRPLPPMPASAGDIYYNSLDNKLKVYNGTVWMDCY
ncbi:MAG: hypothetical protein ABIJ97_17395 [Bacteroidota bacterium]